MTEFVPNGKNRTPEVVKVLLHAADGTVLHFAPGTYDFYGEGVYEGYFSPSCNKSSDKKVIFPFLNLNNVTLDGGGADFIFHDRVFPFVIQNCQGVTVKNFTMDFSFPRCCIADVVKVTDEGFELFIDRQKYRYSVTARGNLNIKVGSDEFSTGERRFFLKSGLAGGPVYYLAAGKIFYENKNLPAPVLYCKAEKTENGVFLRYTDGYRPDYREHSPILISFDEQRDNDMFFLERSCDLLFEDIRIFSGAGMGFTGQCCENVTLRRCAIDPRGNGSLDFSTTADGILLTNFSGQLNIEDCRIRNTMDDAFSIHGFYTKVECVTAPKKAVAKLLHRSQGGVNVYFPGDRVVISDGTTMREKGMVTIKYAHFEYEPYDVLLDFEENIEELLAPGDFIENRNRTPNVRISGCTFENVPHLRIGTAGKTVFENNTLKQCGGILINDILGFWYASGPVRDLTITNNTFISCGCGINAIIDRDARSDVRHQNVKIISNCFADCPSAISIQKTDGLTVRGNTMYNVKNVFSCTGCTNVDSDIEV